MYFALLRAVALCVFFCVLVSLLCVFSLYMNTAYVNVSSYQQRPSFYSGRFLWAGDLLSYSPRRPTSSKCARLPLPPLHRPPPQPHILPKTNSVVLSMWVRAPEFASLFLRKIETRRCFKALQHNIQVRQEIRSENKYLLREGSVSV